MPRKIVSHTQATHVQFFRLKLSSISGTASSFNATSRGRLFAMIYKKWNEMIIYLIQGLPFPRGPMTSYRNLNKLTSFTTSTSPSNRYRHRIAQRSSHCPIRSTPFISRTPPIHLGKQILITAAPVPSAHQSPPPSPLVVSTLDFSDERLGYFNKFNRAWGRRASRGLPPAHGHSRQLLSFSV
jgi:hypothetical protein